MCDLQKVIRSLNVSLAILAFVLSYVHDYCCHGRHWIRWQPKHPCLSFSLSPTNTGLSFSHSYSTTIDTSIQTDTHTTLYAGPDSKGPFWSRGKERTTFQLRTNPSLPPSFSFFLSVFLSLLVERNLFNLKASDERGTSDSPDGGVKKRRKIAHINRQIKS